MSDYENIDLLEDDEKRSRRRRIAAIVALIVFIVVLLLLLLHTCDGHFIEDVPEDNGSKIYTNLDGMTDEEKQDFVDERTAASVITVSVSPIPELSNGMLRVNFIVPSDNNGFSERLEIEQNGRIVCRSEVIAPGGYSPAGVGTDGRGEFRPSDAGLEICDVSGAGSERQLAGGSPPRGFAPLPGALTCEPSDATDGEG